MPLAYVPLGRKVRIVQVRAGKGLLLRLSEMGIFPGAVFDVVSDFSRGPIILQRGAMRIGLGRGVAFKIWVQIIS